MLTNFESSNFKLKFEFVEVLDVLTDLNDANSTAISGRYVGTQQNSPIEQTHTFYPLDPNNLQIPVRHEVVLGTEFLGRYYYMSKLNVQNSPIANTKPNISSYASKPVEPIQLGKYFTENPSGAKKLITREGDTILQGRFGNSIRLGSNQNQDFFDGATNDEDKKYINSPSVKIVSGIDRTELNDDDFYYQEDLNTEKSSIYLTTNEELRFGFGNKEVFSPDDKPQITIQSNRIVFHGREEFNVYSPSINLGDDENLEPGVLGNSLKKLLEDILDVIENTNIGAGQTTLPTPFAGKLKNLINDSILSNIVKLK